MLRTPVASSRLTAAPRTSTQRLAAPRPAPRRFVLARAEEQDRQPRQEDFTGKKEDPGSQELSATELKGAQKANVRMNQTYEMKGDAIVGIDADPKLDAVAVSAIAGGAMDKAEKEDAGESEPSKTEDATFSGKQDLPSDRENKQN